MITNRTTLTPKLPLHGEVWLVDFDPSKGDEIMKTRPAIIISSDAFKTLHVKIFVPLTGWQEKFSPYQWMVKIDANMNNGLDKDSAADALQLRSVSYQRFNSKLGTVSASLMDEIKAAVAIVIELQ